jgi:hypothetical protein
MKAEEARRLISLCEDPEEPVALPASVLSELTIHDLPEGVALHVGITKEGLSGRRLSVPIPDEDQARPVPSVD